MEEGSFDEVLEPMDSMKLKSQLNGDYDLDLEAQSDSDYPLKLEESFSETDHQDSMVDIVNGSSNHEDVESGRLDCEITDEHSIQTTADDQWEEPEEEHNEIWGGNITSETECTVESVVDGAPESSTFSESADTDTSLDLKDGLEIADNGTSVCLENLPQCRTKRSYVCGYCNMKTLNPREYLYHLRDSHGELIRIFECSRCVYASKSMQKLTRHNYMVHKILPPKSSEVSQKKPIKPKVVIAKKPGLASPMNRSPREAKSPRRFEEYEFTDDIALDLEEDIDMPPPPPKVVTEEKKHKCGQCDFVAHYAKVLLKHEAKCHLKKKFYKCSRCSYATHIKARYTKHMKYHKLPVVKCEFCDFSTPYRWNLDRHMKNHSKEGGELKCHLCNFRAQIKQSLTVHIANHHHGAQVPSTDNKKCKESDYSEDITEEEMEMLRMERDEDPDAFQIILSSQSFTVSNIDMGSQNSSDTSANSNNEQELHEGAPKPKKSKIKMTIKKMKPQKDTFIQGNNERHDFNEHFVRPDDVVHRPENVYLKTEKCKLCPFKAQFRSELLKHAKKAHGISKDESSKRPKKVKTHHTSTLIGNSKGAATKTDSKSITDLKYVFQESKKSSSSTKLSENVLKAGNELDENETSESFPKKKPSFFDKLQEKLSSSNVENLVCQFCGHESKCLSESVRHQKLHLSAKNIYASASLSTRCQFCRHRCKTTDDLVNHLKSCNEARKNQIVANENENPINDPPEVTGSKSDPSTEVKHPMENRVFVWNNFAKFSEEGSEKDKKMDVDGSCQDKLSNAVSDSSYSHDDSESNPDIDVSEPTSSKRVHSKNVYRCPHCNFWSTTASRFHVHIVGHYNKKPYSCSECGYRSNWRWDITKHIKLKTSRKDGHKNSEILVTDVVAEKNYDKYERYISVVNMDEMHANRTEGGMLTRRNKPKRIIKANADTDSSKSSPCPTPVTNKIPAPPKLTRAPNRKISSSPGPNPCGPIIPGGQMFEMKSNQSNNTDGDSKKKFSIKPPPLVAMGSLSQMQEPVTVTPCDLGTTPAVSDGLSLPEPGEEKDPATSDSENASLKSNYQIITPQGAMNTSLETLQLLASGSKKFSLLKNLQKKPGEDNDSNDVDAISHQDGENCTSDNTSEIMKLVLDHEGNPEWKCSTCDFRDNEQDTVVQHVRLAHSKKGPVSLLHAVHRCNVCGFAAGTKRHVLLHIDTSHGGRGGIISRSEGQNVEPDAKAEENSRSFDCRMCPFSCKKQKELKNHLSHHTPRLGYLFKCMYCPYYVATKNELLDHLVVHGMNTPGLANESNSEIPQNNLSSSQDESALRHFVCGLCPFETRSRAKLMHHRQFHRPRGLPFSCPQCSYNVTRRHLLAQHLRIHGVSPTEALEESAHVNGDPFKNGPLKDDPIASGSKSPSPSLTITPISSLPKPPMKPLINPACLPTLSDELTKNLCDIPLVWVSRDTKFFKMFKCRHCPHVNLRKTNIQEHEKMHRAGTLPPGVGHACQFCSYMCINAGVMTSHLKVHSGTLGKCHAIVDQALPNEEQLHMLAGSSANHSDKKIKKSDEKLLYYCQQCPGRFFFEKEVHIHSRFHSSTNNFIHQCQKCNFSVRDPQQLLSHAKVHTPEYHERTRTLMTMHPSAPAFPPIPGNSVSLEVFKAVTANSKYSDSRSRSDFSINGFIRPSVSSPPPDSLCQPPPTSRFKCDKCPSTFSKLITLQYHQSLHSANNPFKCNRCTYAAKTQLGLDQHLALHVQAELEKVASVSVSITCSPALSPTPHKSIQETLGLLSGNKTKRSRSPLSESIDQPPIKLKLIGLKGESSAGNSKKQFKYYIEEQVPLSGIDLFKRKNQIEREMPKDYFKTPKLDVSKPAKSNRIPKTEDRIGNPSFFYPLHIDRSCGKTKDKRYKCIHCPSAFEKLDQFNVHINLHGANYKYKCRMCDYSVKFYANFMMHIKRHKYHEQMDAQAKGIPAPQDDDPKFEPFIGENPPVVKEETRPKMDTNVNKENQFDFGSCSDMTTVEKQHILLQQKKGDIMKSKKEEIDRNVFYCQYCPYANTRRDGVDSHSMRHEDNNGRGIYKCNFCDYTASQPNFIREHTKVHFRPFKYVQPEGYMRHDKLEIWSICSIENSENGMGSKTLVIGHEDGKFIPTIQVDVNVKIDSSPTSDEKENKPDLSDESNDFLLGNGICIDFRSGDVVDAPAHMK